MNSQKEVSGKLSFHYDTGYDNEPLASLCHVVYATLGFRRVTDEML